MQPSTGWSVALAAFLLVLSPGSIRANTSNQPEGSTSACDPSTHVACRNQPDICVELERVQDGVADCPDSSDEDCQPWEFTCLCGQPRCISSALIGNGVLDCADGSDEGLIGGHCNYDEDLQNIDDLIRYRRSSDVRVEVNDGQTTTFFLKTETAPGRRPLGLITSTKGTFVNEGTTTEYATQILGTHLDGTYAKIQSTQSRVFSLIPTEDEPRDALPTGLVSSTVVTRIRGETTTIETTQFVRTFIDDEYAQEVLTSSEIFAPVHEDFNPSAVSQQQVIPTVVIDSSLMSPDDSGKIQFKTSHLTSLVGERVIEASIVNPEEEHDEDDSGKIITSFNEEVVDNNLRASRARDIEKAAAEDEVSPSKPAVAIETFVASPIPSPPEQSEPVESAQAEDEPVETSATDSPSDELALEPEVSTGASDPAAAEDTTSADVDEDLAVTQDPNSIREGRVEAGTSLVPTRPPIRTSNRPSTVGVQPSRPISTSRSQLVQPTGLLSTFEGSLVFDGTTTVYTSSVFGTFIDGEYANVVSSTSSLILPSAASSSASISPTVPAVAVLATALPEEPAKEMPTVLQPEPELDSSLNQPTEAGEVMASVPLGMLSVTRLTTFTYFTTFFMTKDESTITSVVTREVVSSEVQLVEETAMDSIQAAPGSPAVKSGNETGSVDGDAVVSTAFTTYTYFTTFFDERTTKLLSREEVVSNLVTLTNGQQLSPTSVAREDQETTKSPTDPIQPSVIESSLAEMGSEEVTGSKRKQLFNSLASGIIKTFFTTFTFFTTALVNGSTVVSSRIVVSSNAVTPTVELTDIDEDLWESLKAQDDRSRSTSAADPAVSTSSEAITPSTVVVGEAPTSSAVEPVSQAPSETSSEAPVVVETSSSLPAVEEESPASSTDIAPTPPAPADVPAVEQASEEPATEVPEIDPSTVTEDPSLPKTFYTTFTYFTTFFTDGTSNIVSNEETVTNVVTDPAEMADPTVMAPIQTVFPITYYTTYTYRTTSISEGETFVSTREETVSNVVTPTVGSEASAIDPSVVQPTVEITPTVDPGLITHYTTFTYFTTSFDADTAIVSSSLETITNIVSITETPSGPETITVTPSNSARNIGKLQDPGQLLQDITDSDGKIVHQPTGLLTTIKSTQVNDGKTTLFTTDVLGTFINGQYARILESSSEVLPAGRAPTVIVAASGVEDVETTDLFPTNGSDLEGSIQPTESEGGSRGPSRSRTFTPAIRPFTQRVRPSLSISKKPRPTFPAGASRDDSSSSAAIPAGSSSAIRSSGLSSSNRFRPSSAIASAASASSAVESSSRSQFFRIRGSSQIAASSSINPTPVASASSSRSFGATSSIRSSIGGPRRPSTLQAGSLRPALSTSRFTRPTTPSSDVEESSTDEAVEAVTTASRPSFSPRRPSPVRPATVAVETSPTQPSAAAPTVTGRRFPFSRGTPRPQLLEKPTEAPAPSQPAETSSDSPSTATGRPRFVRPPKVTFTEKPRAAVRLPTRPGGARRTAQGADATELDAAPSTIAEEAVLERTKRQSNWEYYYYDPVHYRRPSRQQSSRSRSRSNSRVVSSDYDYDTRTSWDASADYEDFDEPVTKRTTSSSSSSFRDRVTSSKQSSSGRGTSKPRTSSRTSSSTSKSSGVSRNRKPVPEELVGSSKTKTVSATARRGEVQSSNTRQRAKTSFTPTTERPARRFGNSRKPSNRNRLPTDDDEDIDSTAAALGGSAPLLSAPVQVTHKVPTQATIPVVNNGQTEFKTVITASPSVEVLSQYMTAKVSGTWRYIASEISATPSPGVTVITQYVLKPSETSAVTFTPTTIRGRPTSFSHLVPSTVYEVEPIVSTISDPVASTNNLLQQLLLGGLQQAQGIPVTSFITHTSTYVTTLVEHKSTKIPITLRGKEIFTTIVGTSSSVVTVTEMSTETIVTGQASETMANPLVNLLPALLGNPLLAGQLLQQPQQIQPTQALPIQVTQAPQIPVTINQEKVEEMEQHQQQEFEQEEQNQDEFLQQQQSVIEPDKPVPQTSVITLFISGRRPGEFSSVLSTITLDGADSTVVKRQTSPSDVAELLEVEASELPFMLGTEKGYYALPEMYSSEDLDYFVMSAINEIGAEAIAESYETERLESILSKMNKRNKAETPLKRKARQVVEFDLGNEDEELMEAIEAKVDEVVVDPVSGRQARRKLVTVTKTLSDADRDSSVDGEFGTSNRARKVLVATRRRSQGATDILAGAEEQLIRTNPPSLLSSLQEADTEPNFGRNGLDGDVYAPRTYYTVYSYFYTLLNGPNSGQVSTREVSISEAVRGSDARIPSGFQRTEKNNGLYTLSRGLSTADLSTRVSNGITTQVNLASMTMVKYGRGSIRADSLLKLSEDIKPVNRQSAPSRSPSKVNISPTPRVEPSFEAFEEEKTVSRTQRLPTARRTSTRQEIFEVETSTSKRPAQSRGRGTIRFNAASVLGDQPEFSKALVTTTRRAPRPSAINRGRRPIQHLVAEEEEPFEEEEEFVSDFEEQALGDEDYEEPLHEEDELSLSADGDADYEDNHHQFLDEKPKIVTIPTVADPIKPSTVSVSIPPPSTPTSTKLIGVTPTITTRSTIRKLLNPLESHLSSILAHSRSSLKASSSVSTTNDPGASSSTFVPRQPSRSSIAPTAFKTSTVVFKTFETLSTLPVDGGRSGIPLTLITSSLTTLYDSELSLLTQSPDMFKPVVEPTQLPLSRPKHLNLSPTARQNLPNRASVVPSIESTIEDTSTEFNTESSLFRADGLFTVTVVETELRTFTAVVTRKSGNEVEEVTTRLEVLPEVVTKTIVQVNPTSVLEVEGSLEADEAPQARTIPSREGREQVLPEGEDPRLARLEIVTNRNSPQNFATRVMSNGVEVIVAGEKKPSLLAQNVIQHSQTVIEPSPPITLAASTLTNQVRVASEVENVQLFSSIQSDPAKFWTQTQMTTFTYLTTLIDGDSKVVSSREEVITNLVTQETGHQATSVVVAPSVTLTSGAPGSSNYNTLTQMTTYTYFNTFMDFKRPVVITSKETVSNVVTVPAGQPVASETAFETSTYLRTYVFSSKLDRDALATSKEVVTQIVVTEAPILAVRPTPVATYSEVTKTYLSTVVLTTTEVEGTDSLIRKVTTVRPEIVVETIRDFEPTPVLEGSQIQFTEDDFGFGELPIMATKTYFTTMTHFTTVQQGTKTIVQSRKEVKSSVVTETINGLASLFVEQAPSAVPQQDAKPTYVQLGPNLFGKLRTLFATATYFITNSAGEVTSKRLVVPQITTETVPLSAIPSEAVIEPSIPILPDIEATPVPSSSQILNADQLNSLKQSFLAGQASSSAVQPSLILSPEQLSSIKESFLSSSTTSVSPTDGAEVLPGSTDGSEVSTDSSTEPGFTPPDISLSPPEDSATVIMVTNTAGEVLIIPTEILNIQPSSTPSSSSSSSSSSSGISGGTLASILGGLGTLGLTALGQSFANNNPGGLNINLGPMFDAMTGVLSNGLIAARRNSSDRSDTQSSDLPLTPFNNPASFPGPAPREPPSDPLFIPIGGLAGVTTEPAQDVAGRRPPSPQTFIPLRSQPTNGQQRPPPPPAVVRRPEPGVPLQPGVPGSPLLRPGAQQPQFTNLQVLPGQPTGKPIRVSFPPLQTGFTGMPNQPQVGSVSPSRINATPNLRPPPFVNGQNNIDRAEIQPTRPLQPVRGSVVTNGHFFAANGQQINVPPLPALAPPPAPPAPPGPIPQQPVDAIRPGAIVPGPDGKPVRIIPVPEGEEPPPGAEGQVFIRPVPEQPFVASNVRGELVPPRREDPINIQFPGVRASVSPSFQLPAVQTIASVEGENKIVRTNIINGDQTIVIGPNDPTPVVNPPSVRPTVTGWVVPSESVTGWVVPSESPEDGGAIEVVGNILKPGLVPSASFPVDPSSSLSPESPVGVTPSREFTFESESGEAVHTPSLDIFLNSPSTEIIPSVFESNLPSDSDAPSTVGSAAWPSRPEGESLGVTSVLMGPEQVFTTIVSRVEPNGRTALSTIINQATQVNYIEAPSTAVPTLPSTSTTPEIEEDRRVPEVITFPADSPFNPPTKAPVIVQPATSSKPSSTPPVSTTKEAPAAKEVMEDKKDHKVVFGGGFGGVFGVNQPSSIMDGCNGQCSKEKLEVCVYANGQHQCQCRPGYSRVDSFESCSKTYTYQLKLVLERVNNTMLHYDDNLRNEISPQYRSLASKARTGLKQALMKTDLSHTVQDSQVMGIHPTSESELQNDGVLVDFFVHLTEKQEENDLKQKLMKSLEGTNFLLGDSEITASRFTDSLQAEDFDECSHEGHHDCSEFAECINEKGSYRCVCRSGFVDSSDETGRICLAERQDCEECNGNGRCVFDPVTNEMECICNRWFTGKECHVNLKVVMIVVLAVGIFLILLITAIVVVCCLRSRRAKGSISGGPSFLRYRGPSMPTTGTLDRSAIIRGDTSSESSGNDNFAQGTSTLDGKARGPAASAAAAGPAALQSYRPFSETLMIPRAKHVHNPANNPGAAERGESASAQREHQLLEYLEGRGAKKDGRSSEVLSAGGRTSVSSTSQFRESLENVEPAVTHNQDKPDHTVMDMTVSEVRSFDETTIHPATRRPTQYYQSDITDPNCMIPRVVVRTDNMSSKSAGYHVSIPQPFTISRPKLYKSFRESDNSNFDSL